MNDEQILILKKLIKSVSVKALVKYYDEFKSLNLENLKTELRLNERWTEKSINSRASKGKRIFSDFKEEDILESLISSKSENESIDKAVEIYQSIFPNKQPKIIRFVRPEFVFGKNIVRRLFQDYEIIEQYPVKNYQIDWYIPELKLAIEYDERHHIRSKKEDRKRQNEISKELGCKFIRFRE